MNKYAPLVELYKAVCVHGILMLWDDDSNDDNGLYNYNMQLSCPNDAMNAFFEHLILRHKRLGRLGISFFERKLAHLLTPSAKSLQKKLDKISAEPHP